MIKYREYFGIFPLISGILLIISLLTPFVHFISTNTKFWLIGLRLNVTQGTFSFPIRFDSMLKALVVLISFVACAILFIRTFFMTWKSKWKAEKIKKYWLISGSVLITTAVINFVFFMLSPESSDAVMDLGFYFPIIAGIVAFVGLFLYRNA